MHRQDGFQIGQLSSSFQVIDELSTKPVMAVNECALQIKELASEGRVVVKNVVQCGEHTIPIDDTVARLVGVQTLTPGLNPLTQPTTGRNGIHIYTRNRPVVSNVLRSVVVGGIGQTLRAHPSGQDRCVIAKLRKSFRDARHHSTHSTPLLYVTNTTTDDLPSPLLPPVLGRKHDDLELSLPRPHPPHPCPFIFPKIYNYQVVMIVLSQYDVKMSDEVAHEPPASLGEGNWPSEKLRRDAGLP
jgi:hypothetical protein